ncbi:hypothetical protein ACWDFL_32190 [Streptomyces bungoensis]
MSSQDTINATPSWSGDTNNITICLQSASNITWWKALVVRGWQGEVVAELDTQDANHGPACAKVADSAVQQLEFWKAKTFGVHTLMYTMNAGALLYSSTGQYDRASFTWTRDS